MIRTIICLLLCLSVSGLRAQDKGEGLIRGLASKIAGYASYQVDFTASMDGEFGDLPGRIVVSGDRYYIDMNGMELFCDGKLLYTYNSEEDEVTVEKPNPHDNSMLSNPSRFFRLSGEDFRFAYKGRAADGGKTVELVELIPKAADAGYHSIRVKIEPSTGLPGRIEYYADSASPPVEIRIGKITPNVPVSAATFTFDKSKHKGVEVIDFR